MFLSADQCGGEGGGAGGLPRAVRCWSDSQPVAGGWAHAAAHHGLEEHTSDHLRACGELADGRTLLLTTAWRSTQAIIAVRVESGRVSRLTPEGPISWVLLDVRNNVVVAGASTPVCPAKLMLGRVNAGWLEQRLFPHTTTTIFSPSLPRSCHSRYCLCLSWLPGASTPACPTKLMLGRVNAGWLKQEGWLWSEISPPHVEYADAFTCDAMPLLADESMFLLAMASSSIACAACPSPPTQVENALKSTEFEVIPIVPSVSKTQGLTEGAKQPFEAIFVRRQPEAAAAPPPAGSKVAPAPAAPAALPPLLVVPHGGPHGVSTTNFVMPYAYLCALGYAVLHVNYRGSLGFGEEALQSLPKHIGRQDVADVLEAIDRVVELGYVDAARMAVIGGSHGGFLAGHLIGQEPDRFRTAVLRNPVTNLASMVGTTDIPDWCFVEAFGQPGMAAFSDSPTAAELQTFLKASPITYASKVKVPTLFVLGGKDLRVPSSNGLQVSRLELSVGNRWAAEKSPSFSPATFLSSSPPLPPSPPPLLPSSPPPLLSSSPPPPFPPPPLLPSSPPPSLPRLVHALRAQRLEARVFKLVHVLCAQGLEARLVHALRAQGLEARVLMMPEDVHAIDKPQSEFEQWITVASWLKQHL
ncbi:unnamed protein product [Closterium sp. NIES-64]|nr:unnamed protein product [Closterium sp. NIES-64]